MNISKPVYDVFLSYAQPDVAWAAEVERYFAEAGLIAYNIARTTAGESVVDTVWDALAESSALVALVSAGGAKNANLAFEVGAAMAWHKPVYVLFKGERPKDLPAYVGELGAFPAAQIERVIELIQRNSRSLSEQQQRTLVKTYNTLGVPADRLLAEPAKVDQLARRFNRAAKSKVSGERLLRELLRLRKQGKFRTFGQAV